MLPEGADMLVDAVGSQLATAVEHAALGGRIVLFGMNQTARPPIHQYTITERSLSVLGSYVTAFTFPTAIRLVEGGSCRSTRSSRTSCRSSAWPRASTCCAPATRPRS